MTRIADRPLYSRLAKYYDILFPRFSEDRCNFVEQMFQMYLPDSERVILDVGCGTGSYTVAFAHRGYFAVGVDLSAEMVEVARRKAAAEHAEVEFVVGDVRTVSFPFEFDCLFCRGVLNDMATEEDVLSFLAAARSLLRPGGLLITDARDYEKHLEEGTVGEVRRMTRYLDGTTVDFASVETPVEDEHLFDVHETCLVRDRDRVDQIESWHRTRYYTPEELRRWLEEAGFEILHLLGDYDLATPLGATRRMTVVCRRA